MLIRILTAVVCLPLVFFLLNIGSFPLQLAILFCSLVSLHEFYCALSKKKLNVHILGYLVSVVYYIFVLNNFSMGKFVIAFSSFIIALLIFLVFNNSTTTIIDCIITLFGFFYVTFLLSFIIFVYRLEFGKFFVWLIFISAWGCDTFAYFSGKIFGKNKLIPNLSPKKTVEGTVGGVVGATLIAVLYAMLFSGFYDVRTNWNLICICTIICFVGAMLSQLGDLSASAIKRYGRLKDYGNILPGHGGFLDRFDSVLLSAPFVYLSMYLIRKFGGI